MELAGHDSLLAYGVPDDTWLSSQLAEVGPRRRAALAQAILAPILTCSLVGGAGASAPSGRWSGGGELHAATAQGEAAQAEEHAHGEGSPLGQAAADVTGALLGEAGLEAGLGEEDMLIWAVLTYGATEAQRGAAA